MGNFWYIDECVVIVENEDGSWSEADNGEGTDGLTYAQAVEMALNDILTNDDIAKFHVDKLTEHLKQLFSRFPHPFRFQILWTFDGEKPLIVEVTEASVPTDVKPQ